MRGSAASLPPILHSQEFITNRRNAVLFTSSARHPGAPGHADRYGQRVVIVRALTAQEADIEEVGPMFLVQFSDGVMCDAFADELTPEDGVDSGFPAT